MLSADNLVKICFCINIFYLIHTYSDLLIISLLDTQFIHFCALDAWSMYSLLVDLSS